MRKYILKCSVLLFLVISFVSCNNSDDNFEDNKATTNKQNAIGGNPLNVYTITYYTKPSVDAKKRFRLKYVDKPNEFYITTNILVDDSYVEIWHVDEDFDFSLDSGDYNKCPSCITTVKIENDDDEDDVIDLKMFMGNPFDSDIPIKLP